MNRIFHSSGQLDSIFYFRSSRGNYREIYANIIQTKELLSFGREGSLAERERDPPATDLGLPLIFLYLTLTPSFLAPF